MSSFPEQLQEYALSEITRRIQTGEYPVGSRLVAKTIADSLNISATPVVAAINRLAAQGLVETIPRKGAVVKTFSTTDIGNYFEARTMIECFVAHLAVQNVDKFPESVKKMQEAADQLERVHVEQMDVEQIRKWETQFHSELIKLSDNPQLERLYEFNWSVGSVYFVYSIKKVSPDNFRVSLREHQKILEALLNRDAEQLEFLVREEEEFITGHPVEAELFTLDTIDAQTAELRIPSKDTPVLVYCRSGARSYEAAQRLRSLGYRRVYDIGSMVGWPYGSV